MSEGFATSICCVDGRIQIPLNNWIKQNYSAEFVDTITDAGVDKMIASSNSLDNIKNNAEISVYKHKSKTIVVSGHHNCAGNPVSKDEHISHIKKSVEVIKSWNLNVTVVGVWVNEKWQIELVT